MSINYRKNRKTGNGLHATASNAFQSRLTATDLDESLLQVFLAPNKKKRCNIDLCLLARMSKRSNFVTINSANLPQMQSSTASTRIAPPPEEIGSVWETKYSAEEVSLYVCLAEAQPVAIVVDDDKLAGMVGVLKLLLSPTTNCFGVSIKTQRQQASKQIRKNISLGQGVLVVTPETALFAQSCFPPGVKCKTLLHIAGVESRDNWRKRSMLLLSTSSASASSTSGPDSFSIDEISSLGKQIVMVGPKSKASLYQNSTLQSQYPFKKPAMSAIQARIATARKLYAATSEASGVWRPSVTEHLDGDQAQAGDTDEWKRGVAGRIEALRAKLKILASLPISGLSNSNMNQQPSMESFCPPAPQHYHDSHATRRVKMEILGMLHAPSKIEVEKQTESGGRSLAATKWMDGASGQNNGHPWASVRYGASCDCCARDVREVVEALRDYVDSKAGRKLPKRENEVELATPRLKKTLKRCRVVAFGWRPSVFGDGEEWGGRYG